VQEVAHDEPALTRARELGDRAIELFPVRVIRKFIDHGGPNQAVLIAWNGLTAVFPILLAVAAIGGLLLNRAGITPEMIANLLVTLFPTGIDAKSAIEEGISALKHQTGVFALLALVGFVWTSSGLFGAMEQAFSTVFDAPVRPFVRQKLMALLMMVIFAVLAVLAVGTSALIPLLDAIPWVPISFSQGAAAKEVQAVIGVVAGFVLYFVIYTVVPNRRQRPLLVLPGAVFSGVAFEVLTLLWPVYINLNEGGLNRFGSQFALLFILLTFFYFMGVITMLGADIIAVLDDPPTRPAPVEPPAAPTRDRPPPSEPKRMGRFRRTLFGAAAVVIGVVALRRDRQ
jgi:membrane protein